MHIGQGRLFGIPPGLLCVILQNGMFHGFRKKTPSIYFRVSFKCIRSDGFLLTIAYNLVRNVHFSGNVL